MPSALALAIPWLRSVIGSSRRVSRGSKRGRTGDARAKPVPFFGSTIGWSRLAQPGPHRLTNHRIAGRRFRSFNVSCVPGRCQQRSRQRRVRHCVHPWEFYRHLGRLRYQSAQPTCNIWTSPTAAEVVHCYLSKSSKCSRYRLGHFEACWTRLH